MPERARAVSAESYRPQKATHPRLPVAEWAEALRELAETKFGAGEERRADTLLQLGKLRSAGHAARVDGHLLGEPNFMDFLDVQDSRTKKLGNQ